MLPNKLWKNLVFRALWILQWSRKTYNIILFQTINTSSQRDWINHPKLLSQEVVKPGLNPSPLALNSIFFSQPPLYLCRACPGRSHFPLQPSVTLPSPSHRPDSCIFWVLSEHLFWSPLLALEYSSLSGLGICVWLSEATKQLHSSDLEWFFIPSKWNSSAPFISQLNCWFYPKIQGDGGGTDISTSAV